MLYPINKTTIRLWTHHPDYDIYLQYKTRMNDSSKTTGVFLDQYLPFHPDYIHSDIKFPISPDTYYPNLCNFFNTLEKTTKTEIVIAAHPRSDYEHLPDYFQGRTIIKGKTAEMIRDSTFVIAHSSTSLDFAVLYHKPIVFVTTDALEKMISGKNIIGLYIRTIAYELGKKPINIDHISEFNWDEEMKINKDGYYRYKYNYIKKQGTPEKPMWDIFCSYIQQNNISGQFRTEQFE
jgi:hypothetical protein